MCLAVYLPGLFTIPPVDRDEARFAQASRQMFESVALPAAQRDLRADPNGRPKGAHAGGLLIPMVQDRPRLNKPPLVYWLQSTSAWLFSGGDPAADAVWMYRVPSVLCAIAAVLLTWRLGSSMFDPRAALLAGAFLAVCPMVAWDAHQARADQLLLATTTACMACLWSALHRGLAPAAIGFWFFLGAGILAKGPITPMVVGLALLAMWLAGGLRGRLGRLRLSMGIPVLLLTVAPWFWLVASRFGLDEYARMAWDETFARALQGSREGHLAPPGTHLVLAAVMFWPGCLGVLLGVARAFRIGWPHVKAGTARRWPVLARSPGRDAELFLLAWLVPSWLVFEASLAKLPHYPLPLYPALALLSARCVLSRRFAQSVRRFPALLGALWAIFGWLLPLAAWAAVGVYVLFGSLANTHFHSTGALAGLVLCAAISTVLAWSLGRGLINGRPGRDALQAVALAVVFEAGLFQFLAPAVAPGALTEQFVAGLNRVPNWMNRPLASTYHEDSIVFWTRGHVRRIKDTEVADFVAANPAGILMGLSRNSSEGPPPVGWTVAHEFLTDTWLGNRTAWILAGSAP